MSLTKEEIIRTALGDVYDPETGIDIVSMGLIYGISFNVESGRVDVLMTLTTPACPMSEALKQGVVNRLERVDDVREVVVELVFDPPWTPKMVSEEARAKLGLG